MTKEQSKLKGYYSDYPSKRMVYCERDSADSYYLALTIGKQLDSILDEE